MDGLRSTASQRRASRLAFGHCDVNVGVYECFYCCSGGYLDGWEVGEGEEEWGEDVGGEGEGGGGGECLRRDFDFVGFDLFSIALHCIASQRLIVYTHVCYR